MNRTFGVWAVLAVLALPSLAQADTISWPPPTLFSFANASGSTPEAFTVFADVFGPNNLLSVDPDGNKTWRHEFLSPWNPTQPYWSVLNAVWPWPPVELDPGTVTIQVSSNGGFQFHSYIAGTDLNTQQFWSHEITLTGPKDLPTVLALNVEGAFNYVETVRQASNYTTDNSTSPLWTRMDATGTATLTALKSVYPEAYQVPEPASAALVGVAGLLLSSRRVHRAGSNAVTRVRRRLFATRA